MANTKKPFHARDFPKQEQKKAEKPEVDAAKEKAAQLAELYPLNPGGVSSDIDPVPQPAAREKTVLKSPDNPGGVRNPDN